MKTRYCNKCKGRTPWNKAESRQDSPYICEGCGAIKSYKEIKK